MGGCVSGPKGLKDSKLEPGQAAEAVVTPTSKAKEMKVKEEVPKETHTPVQVLPEPLSEPNLDVPESKSLVEDKPNEATEAKDETPEERANYEEEESEEVSKEEEESMPEEEATSNTREEA